MSLRLLPKASLREWLRSHDFVISQNPRHAGFCVLRAFVIVSNQALLKVRSLATIEFSGGLASYDIEEVLHRRKQGRFLKLPEVVGTAGFEPATPTTPSPKGIESV